MSIPIIDTHQHLVYADIWPYSWTNDIPQLAQKNFHYEDYLKAIEGTGIAATVFMEATPDGLNWHNETKFVDDMSRTEDSLIQGLIVNCRPEEEDFAAYLDSIADYKVKGLRRILHVAPEGTAQTPAFVPNLQRLAKYNLPFDFCVFEKQLPMAADIAKSCPEVQFILDHCGVPEINGGDYASWASAIKEISKLPNVACKISGLLAYCPEDSANTETVRPYIEHAIEIFGWDRVVWGSDWPLVTITSNLQNWVATTREILAGESEENQAKLLHKNAERIYKLQPLVEA
ncbi:MAG: amidohydrolase family protein [Coraliomargaritaceae bacterium]